MESYSIFDALTDDQMKSILAISTRRKLVKNTVIYQEGEPSKDVHILTDGVLLVSLWGRELGRIFAVSFVGEMGLFTKENRSADVTTMTNCILYQIKGEDLFALLEKDKDIHILFLETMLGDVSHKLRILNEIIAKQRGKGDKI